MDNKYTINKLKEIAMTYISLYESCNEHLLDRVSLQKQCDYVRSEVKNLSSKSITWLPTGNYIACSNCDKMVERLIGRQYKFCPYCGFPVNKEKEMNKEIKLKLKENELYQEIELFRGETEIGEAEIDLKNHMLAKLVIFEPYQNRGYGTEIVKMLTEKYNLNNLWVRADNERAIHVYEKCGFKINKPTMYEMVKESND